MGRFVVSIVYFLHEGGVFSRESEAARSSGRISPDKTGLILINKEGSAEGDKKPDRSPELLLSTDITRCGRAVVTTVVVVGFGWMRVLGSWGRVYSFVRGFQEGRRGDRTGSPGGGGPQVMDEIPFPDRRGS